MPIIMPIKDLRDTNKILKIAEETQEPIFITKNGYNKMVLMSAELYKFLFEDTGICSFNMKDVVAKKGK